MNNIYWLTWGLAHGANEVFFVHCLSKLSCMGFKGQQQTGSELNLIKCSFHQNTMAMVGQSNLDASHLQTVWHLLCLSYWLLCGSVFVCGCHEYFPLSVCEASGCVPPQIRIFFFFLNHHYQGYSEHTLNHFLWVWATETSKLVTCNYLFSMCLVCVIAFHACQVQRVERASCFSSTYFIL